MRLSLLCGAPASTEGHSMALPALGWKVTGEVPGVVPGMSRATQLGSVTPGEGYGEGEVMVRFRARARARASCRDR